MKKIVAEFPDVKAAEYVTGAFDMINGLRTAQGHPVVSPKKIAAQFLIDATAAFYKELRAKMEEENSKRAAEEAEKGHSETASNANTTTDTKRV